MADFFPEESGIEHESSRLTMGVMRNGALAEELHLDALLLLHRSAPQRTLTGHRHFEFEIAEWEVQSQRGAGRNHQHDAGDHPAAKERVPRGPAR